MAPATAGWTDQRGRPAAGFYPPGREFTREAMRARDVRDHLRSLDDGWVDWEETVDTFKAGDPDAEVDGIAVGWMSYTWALERAVAEGCSLFVTHEPTFFRHREPRDAILEADYAAPVREHVERKLAFIEDNDLAVLRCHDVWDRLPAVGIPDSWGEKLGFGDPVAGEGYFRVYEPEAGTARDLARRVADRTADLEQGPVELVGPADAPVSRVAVGTGAVTPYPEIIEEYDVDAVVASDDGFTYWRDGALAVELGLPAVVVNHATSEVAGIAALADHLDEQFDVPVHHVAQSCQYRTVEA